MTGSPNGPIWECGDWHPLAPLAGEISADACVVGLGGSGLACATELAAQGASVVGIDAVRVAAGAAGRNGGFLLAGMAPFYHQAAATLGRIRASAIYRSTLTEMDRMTAADPDLIRRVGSLRIAASPDEMEDCAAQFAAMRADDLPVDRYEGPEGEGLLFPADGVFHPVRRCQALARRLIASGARLFERSAALRIAPGLVETETGRVRAGSVIVAVDGGLETIFPELAGRVRTARLQMLATAPVPDTSFPRPVYYRWGYEYWQQLEDGRIALGGFRDYGGENEWTTDPTPGGRVQRRLEGFLRTHLRVTAPITHRWAASVGYSHAALPLLVEVRRRVWATGGYSGTGNVIGALCGRAAAQIALTGGSAMEIVASD